jgi:transposase
MLPRLLQLHPSTCRRLTRLSKEAERDGAYRVAKRLRAVVLNSEGYTSGELASILPASRSKVSAWLQRYQTGGVKGLLEGYRPGRPSELTEKQQQQLGEILDSGPAAYGLDRGIWTSPLIAWIIAEEFGVQYHPGPVRKLLPAWGFSVQRPRRVLARADAAAQNRWRRRTYPALQKNTSATLGADLHGRSQLPAGLDPARHREPRGLPGASSRHGRAQERESFRSRRTLARPLRLPPGHGL